MSDVFDLWTERAAIMEFEANLTRFEAETRAAECYGVSRREMLEEARNANGHGFVGGNGHNGSTVVGKRDANDLSRVQPSAKEENRSMPFGQPETGRDSCELLALRMGCGAEVQQ